MGRDLWRWRLRSIASWSSPDACVECVRSSSTACMALGWVQVLCPTLLQQTAGVKLVVTARTRPRYPRRRSTTYADSRFRPGRPPRAVGRRAALPRGGCAGAARQRAARPRRAGGRGARCAGCSTATPWRSSSPPGPARGDLRRPAGRPGGRSRAPSRRRRAASPPARRACGRCWMPPGRSSPTPSAPCCAGWPAPRPLLAGAAACRRRVARAARARRRRPVESPRWGRHALNARWRRVRGRPPGRGVRSRGRGALPSPSSTGDVPAGDPGTETAAVPARLARGAVLGEGLSRLGGALRQLAEALEGAPAPTRVPGTGRGTGRAGRRAARREALGRSAPRNVPDSLPARSRRAPALSARAPVHPVAALELPDAAAARDTPGKPCPGPPGAGPGAC